MFVEARGNTQTMDYPFGIVEMQLDRGYHGEDRQVIAEPETS